MGIIKRVFSNASAALNRIMDEYEYRHPVETMEETFREHEKGHTYATAEAATVIAFETGRARKAHEKKEEAEKLRACAKQAVASGDINAAERLLQEREDVLKEMALAHNELLAAKENADIARASYEKSHRMIQGEDRARRAVKATLATAKLQDRVNRLTDTTARMVSSTASNRCQENAQEQLDIALAHTELLGIAFKGEREIEDLKQKYGTQKTDIQQMIVELQKEIAAENSPDLATEECLADAAV